MKDYSGLWVKLQSNLMSVQERYPGSSIKVSFLRYESDVQCASEYKQFTTLSKLFEITMNPAWDRLCREQAHAI